MRIINLNENEIKDYIKIGSKKPIFKSNPNTKIRTKSIYKAKRKNYLYYSCKRNKLCEGKAKIDKTKNILIITNEYSTKIQRNTII